MLEDLFVVRQIGMDDQADGGQVESARSHVGGDEDVGGAVAEGLQGAVALVLRELAREGNGCEAALTEARPHAGGAVAGGAEDDGGGGVCLAEHIDDRVADLDGRDQEGLHIDVGVLLVECVRCDADGALLEGACELLDLFGQRGREHQRAALCRGCLEDGLELFAEAHVEHLVGLIEDGNPEA